MDESPLPPSAAASTAGEATVEGPNPSEVWRAFLHFLADDALLSELMRKNKIRVLEVRKDSVYLGIASDASVRCACNEHAPCPNAFMINMTTGTGFYKCLKPSCGPIAYWGRRAFAEPHVW
jgi:hypothetical protein